MAGAARLFFRKGTQRERLCSLGVGTGQHRATQGVTRAFTRPDSHAPNADALLRFCVCFFSLLSFSFSSRLLAADFATLLFNSGQGNGPIREQAEKQLRDFAAQNLGGFVLANASIVPDESKPLAVRAMAALNVKNLVDSRNQARQEELAQRWLSLDAQLRQQAKMAMVAGLGSPVKDVRRAASQAVAGIALVEIPARQWVDCVDLLSNSAGTVTNNAVVREASLTTLGYICEAIDPDALGGQSNTILAVLIKAMSQQEEHVPVRLAAVRALLEAVVFIEGNMLVEQQRSAIMQVVCANTQLPNLEVRVASFQVLVEIARLYYVHLPTYMQTLFNLTLKAIKTDEELVAQQAIEFWATIAEVELDLQRELEDFGKSSMTCHHFLKGSVKFLAPPLMDTLTKQDEDPESEDWNAQKAAACCLRVIASLVRDDMVQWVMPFVMANISHQNWRPREAAVLAFGCVLDGPSTACLTGIINQAMSVLLKHMGDKEQIVRDTTAWTIGAICELHPTLAKEHAHQLIVVLVDHLAEKPAVAAQVCYAIHYLAEAFEEEKDNATSPLSRFFHGVVQKLMLCCDRNDLDESNLRAAVYEALNSMITSVAQDQLQLVGNLMPLFLTRLDATAKMEDKNAAADLQALICGVLLAITSRLGEHIRAFSDDLMRRLLAVFSTPVARVHEEALLAIAGLANALGSNFDRYAATPYLQQVIVKALRSTDDSHVSSVAVSLVSDMSIALDEKMAPYCDVLMTVLLQNLQSAELDRDIKPSILSCIGDIALAITGNFEKYLVAVTNVLQQASQTRVLDPNDLEFVDYVDNLREGVFEAYTGILHGLSTAKKAQLFAPYMQHCVAFIEFLAKESEEIRDNVLFAGVSFIGDVAKCLGPPGIQLLQNRDGIRRFVQLASTSKNQKTFDAAEWAKSKLTQRP